MTSINDVLGQVAATNNAPRPAVLIVGAGPVGMLLALKLGQAKVQVTVFEKASTTSDLPRALGYGSGAAMALLDAGVWHKARDQGFVLRGMTWRGRPVHDGQGGKRLGDEVAIMPLAHPDDHELGPGQGMLVLRQSELTKLLFQEAVSTGFVSVEFDREVTAVDQDADGVTATFTELTTGSIHHTRAPFLVGTDGGRSTMRKLLGINMPGHTWPERLLATDVLIHNDMVPDFPCQYIIDPVHWAIFAPTTEPKVGEVTQWRYAMALDPQDTRTDEDVMKEEHIAALYEELMPGPRPLVFEIKNKAIYRIHQRLANTLRKGRCILAGDAAHLCNPLGGLGLGTGILDADALGEALVMIINESKPLAVLDVYSDERRKVFQQVVDPISTGNKLRLQSNTPDTAVENDWFFRLLRHGSTKEKIELSRPYNEFWRTNMREEVQKKGL